MSAWKLNLYMPRLWHVLKCRLKVKNNRIEVIDLEKPCILGTGNCLVPEGEKIDKDRCTLCVLSQSSQLLHEVVSHLKPTPETFTQTITIMIRFGTLTTTVVHLIEKYYPDTMQEVLAMIEASKEPN